MPISFGSYSIIRSVPSSYNLWSILQEKMQKCIHQFCHICLYVTTCKELNRFPLKMILGSCIKNYQHMSILAKIRQQSPYLYIGINLQYRLCAYLSQQKWFSIFISIFFRFISRVSIESLTGASVEWELIPNVLTL